MTKRNLCDTCLHRHGVQARDQTQQWAADGTAAHYYERLILMGHTPGLAALVGQDGDTTGGG